MRQGSGLRHSLAVLAVAATALLSACAGENGGDRDLFTKSGRNGSSGGTYSSASGNGGGGGRSYSGGGTAAASLTPGQESALASAESYLSMSGFSRSGLIGQLEFDGYSTKNATVAVDHLDVDWKEQAARSAESYLSMSGFSRSGLVDQLMFEGYTRPQAEYGARTTLGRRGGGAGNGGGGLAASGLTPGQENALTSAESYLSMSGFSRSGLIGQLEFEGYSTKDATLAVDRLSADWNKQAARSAESYLSMSGFSHSGLVEQLMFEGYTRAQAEYGANKAL